MGRLGPLYIRFYGIILVTGATVAAWLASRKARRRGLGPQHIWDAMMWVLILGGSRKGVIMVSQRLVIIAIMCGLLLVACTAQPAPPTVATVQGVSVSVEGGAYINITPAELAAMLKNKDFFFANTHVPYEGEIESTDAFIAYDQTGQRLSEYSADKNAKIVLYCRSGRMSSIAAQELVKAGYTNVWNLDGGMIAWEKAGYELRPSDDGH